MGVLLFDITNKTQRVQKEATYNHMWYDHVKMEMKHLVGGQLDFKYDFRTKELSVTTVPVLITTYVKSSDEPNIVNWIDSNADDLTLEYVDAGIDERIAVTFPDDKRQEIEQSLMDTTFDYEII